MKYIVYKRFKERALCGEVNIPAMTQCEECNGVIYYNNLPLCITSSQNAHDYFSINEDGKGIQRGKLIHNITSLLRKRDKNHQKRWNLIWEDSKCQRYKSSEHSHHWLWNHDFYNASIEDLTYIWNLRQRRV